MDSRILLEKKKLVAQIYKWLTIVTILVASLCAGEDFLDWANLPILMLLVL